MRFIDLFAGVGGIRLGVERACDAHGIAHTCVLSSEINEQACETYHLNFNEHPAGDIQDIFEVDPLTCSLVASHASRFPMQESDRDLEIQEEPFFLR